MKSWYDNIRGYCDWKDGSLCVCFGKFTHMKQVWWLLLHRGTLYLCAACEAQELISLGCGALGGVVTPLPLLSPLQR